METSKVKRQKESQEESFAQEESAPQGETMESLLAQQDSLSKKLTGKKATWVKVIAVTKDQVLVDIGEKREGVVPLSDFVGDISDAKSASPKEPLPAAGQRIPVILVGSGKGDGSTYLSYKRAKAEIAWETAAKAYAEKSRVRGQVVSSIKGGFLVDVGGVSAFLPSSLADLRPVREPKRMLHTGVRCYIIELDESKKKMIISRKAVLEEEAAKRKELLLSELRVGEVRIGRVIHVSPAGLLVDIGGAEGFVRSADAAWGTPKASLPHERGSKLKVKVLAKPQPGEKIPLGIKQLSPNPADAIRKKYPLKSVVRGKVTEAAAAGVKIKLENGSGAFCATVDCGEGSAFKAGDVVSGLVQGVDNTTFDILISIAKYDEMQDRKRVAQYLKAPAPLTLGQLLSPEKE